MPTGATLQPLRSLLSLLCLAFALAVALVKPLGARAAAARHAGGPTRTEQLHLAFGRRVAGFARHLVGIRYAYGGSSPRSGFDCSGFVRYVFAHFGISLPHSSYAQFGLGRRVGRSALRPGDLLFFDGLGHVGVYVGGGRFVHAPHTGTRVRLERLAGWYGSRFDGARRLRSA